jgi:hypothetical protein
MGQKLSKVNRQGPCLLFSREATIACANLHLAEKKTVATPVVEVAQRCFENFNAQYSRTTTTPVPIVIFERLGTTTPYFGHPDDVSAVCPACD